MRISCLNVPIDDINRVTAIKWAGEAFNGEKQHYVVTPNPEIVMLAKRDFLFRLTLERSSLSLLDGIGLGFAARILAGGIRLTRVTGTDFLTDLLKTYPERRFFFLGGENGTAKEAAAVSHKKYHANIVGFAEPDRSVYINNENKHLEVGDALRHTQLIEQMNAVKPEILVVALGHGKQEKWMEQYLMACPSVRLAIGVGGALDYLAGNVERAPKFMRKFGLEWLYRLVHQPQRWQRIWTATVLFPIETMRWWWGMNFRYRPNVVACILNEDGKILIVERLDTNGHWQLPQGGRESGESLEAAARREMKEELGIINLKMLGQSKPNVHWYRFRKWHHTEPQASVYTRKYGYRGQTNTVAYLKFTGNDSDIKVDQEEHVAWRWIARDALIETVHTVRRPLAKIILQDLERYGF